MQLARRISFTVSAALLLVAAAAEARTVIKLGTLAPDGSAWHNILKDMGQQWKKASDGEVVLRIYPGGVAGDEPDMVRKMRIGQLHAAAFTIVGLSLLSPEPQALSIPMMFDSYEELDAVRAEVEPEMESKLGANGYVVLNWGDAGWVRFFAKQPFQTPADLQKLRLFVWTGHPNTVDTWKDSGFKPVPLAATDILSSLQTGLIDVTQSTALVALGTQTFTVAQHMLDIKWAPLVGAVIISAKRWERVPEKYRPELMAIAREVGLTMRAEIRRLDREAVDSMVKRGLRVQPATDELVAEWREVAEKAYPRVRRDIVPTAMFDRVRDLRDRHRARGKGAEAAPAAASPSGSR